MKIDSLKMESYGTSVKSDITIMLANTYPNVYSPVLVSATGLSGGDIINVPNGNSMGIGELSTPTALSRDISLRIRPGGSPGPLELSALRDRVYRAVNGASSGLIKLSIMYKNESQGYIVCVINNIDVDIFTSSPSLTVHMSAVNNTLFQSESDISVKLDRVSVTPITNGMSILVTDNASTAAHGFIVAITFNRNLSGIKLVPAYNIEAWSFEINYDFLDGDIFYLISYPNQRDVYKLTGGISNAKQNLAAYIKPGSTWPLMRYGSNRFDITSSASGLTIGAFTYRETFWGI